MLRRYEIRKIIGEGASSTVYKAFDNILKKFVAIKAFHCDNNAILISESFKRMNNEIEILRKLNSSTSEHILKFIGPLDGTSLILEYCDCSLISFISEFELDTTGIKKIIRMILLALHEMHSLGIIHRDIKLSNILVSDDCVKICDFGLSCFKDRNDFTYCGTRDYLAPEIKMLENSNLPSRCSYYDEKVDIYAVGIMYKILLSRKKNINLSDIDADSSTKKFIDKLLSTDPKLRPSAKECLSDPIFSDLLYSIPDFKLLRDYLKKTKFGIFKKFKVNQVDTIQIEFSHLDKKEKVSIGIDQNDLIKIKVDDVETEKILLSSTYLKYFNILCTYFTYLTERTKIVSKRIDNAEYSIYTNGTKQIQVQNFIIKNIKNRFEVTDLQSANNNKIYDIYSLPSEFKSLFNNFHTIDCNAPLSTNDQLSSFSVMIQPERLVKKCEFIKNLGWAVKEGLNFLILTVDGNKILVKVEERQFYFNDERIDSARDLGIKYLNIVRQFICKYIQR